MAKTTIEEMIHGTEVAAGRERMIEETRAQWDRMVKSMSSLDLKLQAPCEHTELSRIPPDPDHMLHGREAYFVCVSCKEEVES